jgi:hypothetical protein
MLRAVTRRRPRWLVRELLGWCGIRTVNMGSFRSARWVGCAAGSHQKEGGPSLQKESPAGVPVQGTVIAQQPDGSWSVRLDGHGVGYLRPDAVDSVVVPRARLSFFVTGKEDGTLGWCCCAAVLLLLLLPPPLSTPCLLDRVILARAQLKFY